MRKRVIIQNESGLELSQLRKPRAGCEADSVANSRRIATTNAGTSASQACTRTSSTLSGSMRTVAVTIRIGLRRNHRFASLGGTGSKKGGKGMKKRPLTKKP